MKKIVHQLVFLLSLTSIAFAAEPKLNLVGNPLIVVDPLCNQDGKASGKVKVRNDSNAIVSLYLTANDVVSKPAGRIFNGKIVVTPINGSNDDQPSNKKSVAASEEIWLQIEVSGVGEGEWEAVLQNENVDAGKIRIVKNELPFPISMDVPTPDAPELTFTAGQPATFKLKNDGPRDYQVTWEYSIDGHTLRPNDSMSDTSWWRTLLSHSKAVQEKVAVSPINLPRNGVMQVNFHLPANWFGSRFAGLFKDNVQDGRLVIVHAEPACKTTAAIKVFKVKTHLATSSGNHRELWSDVVIFFVLLLGGLCSLTLNFVLPNQMRRQKLKEKLVELGQQVSSLSTKLASRLRVLAGQEQRLLGDRLRNLTWNNPDFTTEMQNIELAATQVDKRIQLLDRLGTTRSSFESLSSLDLPPTVIVEIESLFKKVGDIAKKSVLADAEIQAAQAVIQNIQDRMDARSSPALVAGLSQRVQDLQADIKSPLAANAKWKEIEPNLKGAEDKVNSADPTKIAAKDYLALDRALFKLELAADYARLVAPLPSTDPLWVSIQPHEADLIKALKLDSWEQLSLARNLLEQMRQGQFADDVSAAVSANKVQIKSDRILIRQYEPCEFWMDFPPQLYNASALSEWTCKWEFSNSNEQTLFEEGWQVSHYFQRAEEYSLKVTLIKNSDRTQVPVQKSAIPAIKVQAEKRRRWIKVISAVITLHWAEAHHEWKKSRTGAIRVLETLWLVLAMFLALIGMIAGAKEQVLKLELVPAMIAIFLVGFGADQVKNLLTRKQPT